MPDDSTGTITFIGVENWGEDGDLYWAPGHHDPADFMAAVERWHKHTCGPDSLIDLYGVLAHSEVPDAREEATSATRQTFGRYTMPEDLDPQWADNPWDSEQVRLHMSDELEPGGFPITYWLVS